MRAAREAPQRVWRAPLWIAFASALGLVSALLGDGVWDALSWLALGTPLFVLAWKWHRARAAGE